MEVEAMAKKQKFDDVPREIGGASWLAGRIHVCASLREVVARCRQALRPEVRAGKWRKERHAFIRKVLQAQREHLDLCREFRL